MKLTQMRNMVAVAERGSLRAAARQLDLAQPALTRSIGALEREMSKPVERHARGMVLTPSGKLFYRRASAVINEVRRAHEDLDQTGGDMRGTIAFGLSIMPHMAMLPAALPVFRRRYPKVLLKITEGLFCTQWKRGCWTGALTFI